MKSLSLVPSSAVPVIEGEIVDEPPPLDIQPVTNAAPLSGNGLVWVIGIAATIGFIVGAVMNDGGSQKQSKAPSTRRRTRRKQE